jgi:hypothetical protein
MSGMKGRILLFARNTEFVHTVVDTFCSHTHPSLCILALQMIPKKGGTSKGIGECPGV